ncbi:arylesterase [Amylibacter sp. SFDW26]|uniref:arylesterase n=1 Tax=Amylibacter sp. SFDW26 TaxID=2652722 RepID=UPI0012623929|nr:arylesterase [Amylibacter sp. SFDW26]KAB7615327.1 arylesterase [Amylibacter sp. SFDW26]
MIYCLLRVLGKQTIALLLILFSLTPAYAGSVVIAALGDSLTQGYGLPRENGFVPQLETWLQDKGEDVSVLNAGVSGDTTAGGLSRIAWTLTPEVDALIVNLGGNDLLRGIDPVSSRSNLDNILKVATEKELPVLVVGLVAPGNYGPEYKDAFDPIYQELSLKYETLLYRNFFTAIIESSGVQKPQHQFMQSDGIHPNALGVSRVVNDIGPIVRKLVEKARKN